MRLWTLHPRYLDAKGLGALWREGLLAQAVLQGETRGYRFHPQLDRFKAHPEPQAAIATYLAVVQAEGTRRGYRYDAGKIAPVRTKVRIPTTVEELRAELEHLRRKLKLRAPEKYQELEEVEIPEAHGMFEVEP